MSEGEVLTSLPDASSYEFEIRFIDYGKMRQWSVDGSVIRNQDMGYLKEMLAKQPPEFRAFILESARLICEAGESETERRRKEWPDMRKLFGGSV